MTIVAGIFVLMMAPWALARPATPATGAGQRLVSSRSTRSRSGLAGTASPAAAVARDPRQGAPMQPGAGSASAGRLTSQRTEDLLGIGR